MQADEPRGAVVDIVFPLSEREIEYVDGVDLLHLVVHLAEAQVVGHNLGHTVEHAFEEMHLARKLHLHDDVLAFAVARHHVDTVVLVVGGVLVALALEDLFYLHLLADEDGHQPFEHVEIGLVAKHALGSPVEPDVFLVYHSSLIANH